MRFPIAFAMLFAACTSAASADDSTSAPTIAGTQAYSGTSATQDTTAGAGWSNNTIAEQSGSFHVVFSIVPNQPSAAAADAVVGLSSGAAASVSDLGPIVRFSSSGTIDARNGSTYNADVAFPYQAGHTYQIWMDIDLTNHLYSVMVEENGGHTTKVATNYAFQTTQARLSQLDNVALFSTAGSMHPSGFDIGPVGE